MSSSANPFDAGRVSGCCPRSRRPRASPVAGRHGRHTARTARCAGRHSRHRAVDHVAVRSGTEDPDAVVLGGGGVLPSEQVAAQVDADRLALVAGIHVCHRAGGARTELHRTPIAGRGHRGIAVEVGAPPTVSPWLEVITIGLSPRPSSTSRPLPDSEPESILSLMPGPTWNSLQVLVVTPVQTMTPLPFSVFDSVIEVGRRVAWPTICR